MRRVFSMMAVTSMLLVVGCGEKSYERRLNTTLERMKYQKRLDEKLKPAIAKGKFQELLIYVRPPIGLPDPSKEFLLTVLEPGKFDLNESLVEKDKLSLYVLSRVKRPKGPANKKSAPTAADTAVRGEFIPDVVGILNGVYGLEIDYAKAKEETKQPNKTKFKHLTFEAGNKIVEVYFNGNKSSAYEVALIFEYPKADRAALASAIDLCLGAFETGERARKAFSGAGNEEEGAEAPGNAAPI